MFIAFVTLLLTQTWQPPELQRTYQIWTGNAETSFLKPADCGITKIGGVMIPICDIAPAINRAMAACAANLPTVAWEQGSRIGCDIELPPGRFTLESEIRVCRGHRIWGHGNASWGSGTMLFPPKAGSGFRFAFYDECMAAGEGGGAQGATLERVAMRMRTGPELLITRTHGILIQAPAVNIRDVWIRGFVHGIEIAADVNALPRTNANLWSLERVALDSSEAAALYVHGGDTNAGVAILLDAHTACMRGSAWKAQTGGTCAPIQVHDFLGSTLLGAHASGSFDGETKENFGNYSFAGASNKGTCFGCYSEADKMPASMSPNGISIGGAGGPWTGGARIVGQVSNGMIFANDKDAMNVVELRVGNATNFPAAFLMAKPSAGDATFRQPLTLALDRKSKSFVWEVAHVTTGIAQRIGATINAAFGGYGSVQFPKPIGVKTATISR